MNEQPFIWASTHFPWTAKWIIICSFIKRMSCIIYFSRKTIYCKDMFCWNWKITWGIDSRYGPAYGLVRTSRVYINPQIRLWMNMCRRPLMPLFPEVEVEAHICLAPLSIIDSESSARCIVKRYLRLKNDIPYVNSTQNMVNFCWKK